MIRLVRLKVIISFGEVSKKKKILENSNKALTPPPPYWKIKKKRKMIYAPWNEFCMIWVIFWMPTDQVMAFLCFIFDNQSVDMSGQVWGGGRGGHNWKKQVCLKMLFRQFQVFLALFFFFFFLMENRPSLPPPPLGSRKYHVLFFSGPISKFCVLVRLNSQKPDDKCPGHYKPARKTISHLFWCPRCKRS